MSPEDLGADVVKLVNMAILALGVGVPVFPIAYEFKTEQLFKRLGLGRWVQNIEGLNRYSIIRSLDSYLKNLPDMFETLLNNILKEQASAVESAYILKKHFDDTYKE